MNLANKIIAVGFLIPLVLLIESCGGGGSENDGYSVVDIDAVGCHQAAYNGVNSGELGCGIVRTSGDIIFDQRFNMEALIQQSFWGTTPAVYVFNECSAQNKNAFANPQGYILFGLFLANDLIISTGSELPIAGVLAHEFAHELQFINGWMDKSKPTARDSELEADAFSGLHIGLVKGWTDR